MRGPGRRVFLAVALVGVGLQLVPYGWRHSNPPVVADAPWPDPTSRRLARAACYDCHSNEATWPVYSYVAPMSWLVRNDVEGGREELNFSTWGQGAGEVDEAAETIEDGSMPPRQYLVLHPAARLSTEEKHALVATLASMDGDDGDRGRNRGRGGGD